jgi:hypothetical protein
MNLNLHANLKTHFMIPFQSPNYHFFGVYVLNFIITCAYFYSSWQSKLIKLTFDKALTHVFY